MNGGALFSNGAYVASNSTRICQPRDIEGRYEIARQKKAARPRFTMDMESNCMSFLGGQIIKRELFGLLVGNKMDWNMAFVASLGDYSLFLR